MLLEASDLSAGYGSVAIVHGVTLAIAANEAVAVIGESGSGKSTLARAIVGLAPVLGGTLALDGQLVPERRDARFRQAVQMVFQSPAASLIPRMTIGDTLREAVRCGPARGGGDAAVHGLMDAVGLARGWDGRRPRELSGGQLQRVAIARALAVEPRLLIADEITSALDLSVQAAILNLIADLRATRGLALLFITHDLAVARHVASRVVVMQAGRVVETGPVGDVLATPRDPYTASLLAAEPGRALREARA